MRTSLPGRRLIGSAATTPSFFYNLFTLFSWIAVVSITTTQYSVKKRQVVSMSTAMRALIRASRTLLMRVDITT